jgi:hypothetical protein
MAVNHKVLINIAEQSFEVWAASPVGVQAIQDLGQSIPKMEAVVALGADKAAKKKLWKAAEDAVQDTALGILIEAQEKAFPTYPGMVGGLFSPHSIMPNSGSSFLPDVYALPRYLVKEYALARFSEQRSAGPMEKIAPLLDVDSFIAGWVNHFEAEYLGDLRLKNDPSYLAKEPILSAPNWSVFGYEADFDWKAGAPTGHYFLSHDTLKPGQKPGGKERKEAENNVIKLETELASYDLARRAAVVATLEKHFSA